MQSSNENIGQKSIHAILQQRRMRHITGICVRNLVHTVLFTNVSSKIYFKIFDPDGDPSANCIIFESEAIDYCANPSWLGFRIDKNSKTISNYLGLELWIKYGTGEGKKILSWTWNLLQLRYIAERLYHGELSFTSNALVLQVNGSFYSFEKCFATDTAHGNCPPFNLDEEKISYTTFSIQRMITSQKSIGISESRSSKYISDCKKLLFDKELMISRKRQIEDLKTKIKCLNLLLDRENSMLKSEIENLQCLESDLTSHKQSTKDLKSCFIQAQAYCNSIFEQCSSNRQKTAVLTQHLRNRRIEVLSELAYIFPILPYIPPSGTKSSKNQKFQSTQYAKFVICGIHLPAAENLNPKEDAKNAVAMGYVSQLLQMISVFLVIPLRYPLLLQGSQSSIIDNVIEKVEEKERVFPLYVKTNKERFLFDYAVYLLNKDIAQLRFFFNIYTSDLRPTLLNLKTLLEHAIGNLSSPRSLVVQSFPQPRAKSPIHKLSPTPASSSESLQAGTNSHNGLPKSHNPIGKFQNRSVELNNLRDELFGNKTSKPIPTHVTSSSSSSQSSRSSPVLKRLTAVSDNKQSFLTGLEDLEKKKRVDNLKNPLDVVAARDELFKKTSGRTASPRKKPSSFQFDAEPNSTLNSKDFSKSRTSTSPSTSSSGSVHSLEPIHSISAEIDALDHVRNKSGCDKLEVYQSVGAEINEDIDLC